MSEPEAIAPSHRDPLPKIWDENSKIGDMLRGRRGLIVGVANEHSIAWGCARLAHALGHGLVHEVLRLAHCLWEVGHHAEVGREACGVELHTLWSYLKTILSQLSHAWVLENT